LLSWCLGCSGFEAAAQTVVGPGLQPAAPHRAENGEMLQPARAVSWTLTYNSDLNADADGGERRGAAYLQRIGLIADADLDRLAGWHGAKLHASVHAINGRGLSSHDVGNILTVSGIEAEPALRLFNLWVEQSFGRGSSLRVGQFTAGQEFMISSTASLFVNSTFGWPGSFATDLPSGGPAYPLAAPGIRFAWNAPNSTLARVAMFAGDPGGRGSGDPQRRDRHGFNSFRLKGAPFLIGELSRGFGGQDPPLRLTAGGWIHFDRFDDVAGGSGHARNYAIYGIADARLWTHGTRSLRGLVRASAGPSDRNPIDLYADAGISLTGPIASRPDDTVGIAIGVARISPRLRNGLRERFLHEGLSAFAPRTETVAELTYQVRLGSAAYLQPDVQWIIHPAGRVLDGARDTEPLPANALVIGFRTSLTL
jgi:porin